MRPILLWFRRDLRLSDNPALQAALQQGRPIIPLYIHAPEEEQPWPAGAASRCWLHHSLAALDGALRQRGSALLLFHGPSEQCLQALLQATGADGLYWNRCYEPALIARDRLIKQRLQEQGIQRRSFNAQLLNEPWQLLNRQGQPYRVFSAYWRACQTAGLPWRSPVAAPERMPLPTMPAGMANIELPELQLLPKIPWYQGFQQAWQPGEAGAQTALQRFIQQALPDYPVGRDIPAQPGTSGLSPHLHFGEISPHQVGWAVQHALATGAISAASAERFLSELGWREFAYSVLYHHPHTSQRSMDERFERLGWLQGEQAQPLLSAWQRGETGIPLVDAGMRQLWQQGWMHNRVRMVVASLLTKQLGVHWLEGARWFWDTLLDADLACNSLGWQWSAGCGVDAAPYFRIFNPQRQAQRFDPQGEYCRRWLGQRAEIAPLIDLEQGRKQALARWQRIKEQSIE